MKNKPNFLFFLPDQHRRDWTGSRINLPLRTPNLDGLRKNGTSFSRAYTPSPLCAPARACLASGLDYTRCRVPSNRENYPLSQPTYYQRLRDGGYRVCGVGKFDLHKGENDWNLDGSRQLEEWGFTEGIDNEGKFDGSNSYRKAGEPKGPYLNYLEHRGFADIYAREHEVRGKFRGAYVTELDEDAYCDNWVAENGLKFLSEFPEEQPWHLVVNFTGPHNPMDVTRRMHDRWKDAGFPLPVKNDDPDYTPEDHQRIRRYYAAMIENIDRHVGRFIDEVRDRGELENTVIVYASDHGEMLGDHGLWGKAVWYEASAGIPLIVSGPGIAAAKASDAFVSLHDLTATFLDYAGVPALENTDSMSLRELLAGERETHREFVRSGLEGWRMVFDGRYKLVEREGKPPLLYDLENDPEERIDVSAKNPEAVKRLGPKIAW
ncbi:MAG: sulfatase [Spirochaetia bacterium]